MVGIDFSDWLTALGKFQASVASDLDEIRKQKAEIQQLKNDIFSQVAQGRVIRDDQRLVLSAPEIIIGNVDASGTLLSEGGAIVIRGQKVGLEGVGASGAVATKATTISQEAVDPGLDGIEDVVHSGSSIIQHAKRIAIQSNDCEDDGFFIDSPRTTGAPGVRIHADQRVEIDSSVSSELYSDQVTNKLTSVTSAVTSLTSDAVSAMTTATTLIGEMEALLLLQDPLTVDEVVMRASMQELDSLTEQYNALLPSVCSAINRAIDAISRQAEATRKMTALQAKQLELTTSTGSFTDDPTGASLSITAEQMEFASIDGDGNIRSNPEAAIRLQTGKVDISCKKSDGSLIDESYVNIATHDVNISTINTTPAESEDGDSTFETVGTVNITAKEVSVNALDSGDDGMVQTADSRFSVRMQDNVILSFDNEGNSTGTFAVQTADMQFCSKDSEGNSSGSFNVNAKDFALQSVDKDGTATGTATILAADTAIKRQGCLRQVDGHQHLRRLRLGPCCRRQHGARGREYVCGPYLRRHCQHPAAAHFRQDRHLRYNHRRDAARRCQGRRTARRWQRGPQRFEGRILRRKYPLRQDHLQGRCHNDETYRRQHRGQDLVQVEEHQRRYCRARRSLFIQAQCKALEGRCTDARNQTQ